jgi:ketosteroid isomerase-like protein
MREIEDLWRRWDIETERLIDLGDTVVAFVREAAQARHADLEVQNETAMVFRVARQKIVEARGYLDRDEALRAAGGTA